MPDFASRLRRYREGVGLSQQTLAERCGISWADQQAYEAGTRSPDASYLQALADAGIEVSYLTTGSFPPTRPKGVTQAEFVLLQNFEAVSPEARAEVARLLEEAARAHTHPRLPAQPREPAKVINLADWRHPR